jgi:hypothetical protein
MDILISFFPVVWLLPCAIGAIGLRRGPAPWSVAMLFAAALAEVVSAVGVPAPFQVSIAFVAFIIVLIGLDVRQMYARQEAERAAALNRQSLNEYLEAHPELYAKTGVRRPVVKTEKRSRRWFGMGKRSTSRPREARMKVTDDFADAEPLVEVITPAERAVLRRPDTNGFWIAEAARGEMRVFLPPGSKVWVGKTITVVAKPNGTLMGM